MQWKSRRAENSLACYLHPSNVINYSRASGTMQRRFYMPQLHSTRIFRFPFFFSRHVTTCHFIPHFVSLSCVILIMNESLRFSFDAYFESSPSWAALFEAPLRQQQIRWSVESQICSAIWFCSQVVIGFNSRQKASVN